MMLGYQNKLLNFMENGVFQELPSYNVRPDMRATVYVHVDPKSQNSKGTGGVFCDS